MPKFSGDIAIQACSDNPQVAIHALRNLARAGSGVVEYKWSQLGFGHATATTRDINKAQIYAWRKGIKTLYYIRLRQMALY